MTPQEAIKFFGSARKLAKALSIDPSAVTGWVKRGKVPPNRQAQIAALAQSMAADGCALSVDEEAKEQVDLQKKKRAAARAFVAEIDAEAIVKTCERCRLRPAKQVAWYCGGESISSLLCDECDNEEVSEIERASWKTEKAE